MNTLSKNSATLFVALICNSTFAHQTNSSHPLITEHAQKVVKKSDETAEAYEELYRFTKGKRYTNDPRVTRADGPIFSGNAATFTAEEAVADAKDEVYATFQGMARDIIDGVVGEDISADLIRQRVYSHFYHAYNGDGLWTNDGAPSRLRGEKYFAESAALMGYIDELEFDVDKTYWRKDKPAAQTAQLMYDKHLAYFLFGFSLHHVEDMSSVAHVHNDAHMDLNPEARDDYEATFIPYFIWRAGSGGSDWFLNDNSPAVVVSSFSDIWPDPTSVATGPDWNARSLARRVYNASIFQANIPSPKWNFGANYWDKDAIPTGELIDMFGFSKAPNENGKFWTRRYEIPGSSTKYNLIYDTSSINEWQLATPIGELEITADTLKTDPWNGGGDIWPLGEVDGPNGYYYIEEHINENNSDTAKNDKFQCGEALISPNGVRRDLLSAYHKKDNPLEIVPDAEGCGAILSKMAKTLVPMGIQYSAAYMKWWFDIANTPPYLRRVKIEQEVALAAPNGSNQPEKRKTTVYDARWRSEAARAEYVETQWKNTACGGPFLGATCGYLGNRYEFQYVSKRTLKQKEKLDRGMLTDAFPIELTLEFNEPIKVLDTAGNYDANSGFILGFQPVGKDGVAGDDIWLTNYMAALKYEESDINTDDTDKAPKEPEDKGRVWKVTIPKLVLEAVGELKKGGAMRLIVRARDKNKHQGDRSIDDGELAGSLDVHPDTPARRNIRRDGRIGDPNQTFLWHKNKSLPDQQLFPGAKAGDFDYDVKDRDKPSLLGDRNHILLFSRPTEKELFEGLENDVTHDTVSTTLEPKKQEARQ